MTLLDPLYHEVSTMNEMIWSSKWITDLVVWEWLKKFMEARSPTGSISLPGTIVDTLTSVVNEVGFTENYSKNFRDTGNAAIFLGEKKDQVDLLIDAHLDKPSFGVAELINTKPHRQAVLFACCANRFPLGEYHVNAKALRFDETKQMVTDCGWGLIKSYRGDGQQDKIIFEIRDGEVDYTDLIVFDTKARLEGSSVIGPGIDDGSGVTIILGAASILKTIEPLLKAKSLNCMFTFFIRKNGQQKVFFLRALQEQPFHYNHLNLDLL